MKIINLTQGRQAIIDDADFELVSKFKWCFHQGYAARGIRSKGTRKTRIQRMHQLVMGESGGVEIDHVSGDKLDNRRSNLRLASRSQNACNTGITKANSSGFKGVSWHKAGKKWQAKASVLGKQVYLGLFADINDAIAAHSEAITRMHGAFANNPNVKNH